MTSLVILALSCFSEGEPQEKPSRAEVTADTGDLAATDCDTTVLDSGPSVPGGTADTGGNCVGGDVVLGIAPYEARLVGSFDITAAFDARVDGSGEQRYLGHSLSAYPGDADGNSIMDVIAGAGDPYTDAAVVFLGPLGKGVLPEEQVGSVVLFGVEEFAPPPTFLDVDLDGTFEIAGEPTSNVDVVSIWSMPLAGAYDVDALEPVVTVDGGFQYPTIAPVRDIDEDGVGDMWVAERGSLYVEGESVVRLYLGPLTGDLDPTSAVAQYTQTGDLTLGYTIHLGDLDASGILDVVIGAYLGVFTTFEGRVFLLSDPPYVITDIYDVVTTAFESPPGEVDGIQTVAMAGDVDGDGFDDVAFGQAGTGIGPTDAGALYVQYGPPPPGTFPPSCASTVITSPPPDGNVAPLVTGDFDADGLADIVAGRENAIGSTQYHLFYGPVPTGSLEMADAEAIFGESDETFGMASLGDVSGDGVDDLAFMNPYANEGVGGNSGAIWFFFGGTL